MKYITPAEKCPEKDKHTKCPTDYIGWHNWAECKSKTNKQIKCKACGTYSIWVKKDG